MQIKKVKMPWNWGFEEDIEKAKIVRENSNYCEKCGHRQMLNGKDKEICTHCGTMVFRNEKVKFDYRLKEALIKEKRKNGKDIN
jgi:ribosomal protein S27AE